MNTVALKLLISESIKDLPDEALKELVIFIFLLRKKHLTKKLPPGKAALLLEEHLAKLKKLGIKDPEKAFEDFKNLFWN